jgi:hypothetical protein
VHCHQLGAALQVAENVVQRGVAEFGACATDHHHVGVGVHELHACHVLGDVAAVQQQAAGRGPVLCQVGRRRGRGREHVLRMHREAGIGQRAGDPGPRPGGRVGEKSEAEAGVAECAHGVHRAGEWLPRHGEHTVDVEQDRANAFHGGSRYRRRGRPPRITSTLRERP